MSTRKEIRKFLTTAKPVKRNAGGHITKHALLLPLEAKTEALAEVASVLGIGRMAQVNTTKRGVVIFCNA